MPYIKLSLPPGVFRNGTKYQSMGRWFSANLVRWTEGAMKPIGGWTRERDENGDIDLEERIASLFSWRDNDGSRYLMAGTPGSLWVLSGGSLNEIIDGSFVAGDGSATVTEAAYSDGAYGSGPYGEGSEIVSTLSEAQTWQFDNFGEIPIMLAQSDGRLLEWDLNVGNNVTAVTNAPTDNLGVVVTPERFVVALGADDDPRQVMWSDQQDRTVWTPDLDTNQAGDFVLATNGEIMCGLRVRGGTLIFTTTDLHTMEYIGGDGVYSFSQAGDGCGIISRQAYASAEGRVFWMGRKNFYMYDGFVKPIPCPISDAIFPDMNETQASKVAAVPLSNFNEIWFMYPSAASDENDRVVAFNYVENHWSGPWEIRRTSGVDSSIFGSPYFGGDEGSIFQHENGIEYVEPDEFATALFVSGGAGSPDNGDTITIGTRTYTFQSTLTDSDGNVHIGATEEGTIANLIAAINLSDEGESSTGAGTDYAASTVEHPFVVADPIIPTTCQVTAKQRGTNGNGLTLGQTGGHFTVISGGQFGADTLVGGTDTAQSPSAESGPVEIGKGDRTLTIRRVIPDETSLGDVDLTLFAALYPTADESEQSITTLSEPTDARLTGRQVRLKIEQDQPGWRWGNARLEVVARGRR